MHNTFRRLAAVAGTVAIVVLVTVFTAMRDRRAQALPERAPTVGAEWQKEGLLSENDYNRLRALGHSVVRTHRRSDPDLDWLLATMAHSPNATVHARILGVLGTLSNPPAAQRARIQTGIAPLLHDGNPLDQAYAQRVQRKLGLSH